MSANVSKVLQKNGVCGLQAGRRGRGDLTLILVKIYSFIPRIIKLCKLKEEGHCLHLISKNYVQRPCNVGDLASKIQK